MKEKFFLGIAVVFVISLIYSRFMVSVSMIGMTILAIVEWNKNNLKWQSYFKALPFSLVSLVFLTILLSGINSTNTQDWLHHIKLKLPFLILPWTIFALQPFSKKTIQIIHNVFIGTVVVSAIQVGLNYALNFEEITQSIARGKSIPTPVDHIHYGIMVSYAAIASLIYAIKSSHLKMRIIYGLLFSILFAYAHFLAVRSSIVITYAAVALIVFWNVIKYKKYTIGVVAIAALFTFPYLAYKSIPSLQNKVRYMLYDLEQFQKGKGNNYSDSERLMSYELATELIKKQPVFGHGIGDLRSIMKSMHVDRYGEKEKYIYPHNQYLYILAGCGVIGFVLFFFGLLSPILFSKRNILLASLCLIMFVSFLVENTVQRAVITAFFLFFILINVQLVRTKNQNHLSE